MLVGELIDPSRPMGCGTMEIVEHLDLWNAQRQYVSGWVPSQGDLFAEDWLILE